MKRLHTPIHTPFGHTDTTSNKKWPKGVWIGVWRRIGANSGTSADVVASTAIGYGVTLSLSNQIILGRNTETVYIPGGFDVSGNINIVKVWLLHQRKTRRMHLFW